MTASTTPLHLRVRIHARPDAVFAALTVPDSLTDWMVEHADVDLASGRYEFWGRYVPYGQRGRHQLVGHTSDQSLRFDWLLGSGVDGVDLVPTRVEVSIQPAGESACLVSVVHQAIPDDSGTALRCFWQVSLGNLASFCEGTPTARPFDFTAPAETEAHMRTAIAVPTDEVFASLLDADQVSRWAGGSAVIDARPGGRYDFGWEHGPGTIVELETDKVLSYTWRDEAGRETTVRWELRSSRGHTFVTLVHSGFDAGGAAERYRQLWPGYLMDLKRMLEVGPAWRTEEQ